MNAQGDLIRSEALERQVCEALGLEANRTKRVILDFDAGELPIVYIQMYGDSRLLAVDWERGLHGATVTILDDQDKE